MGSKKKSASKQQESPKGQANGRHEKGADSSPRSGKPSQSSPPLKGRDNRQGRPGQGSASPSPSSSSPVPESRLPWRLILLVSILAGGVAIVCVNEPARSVIEDVYLRHIQPQTLMASERISSGLAAVQQMIQGDSAPDRPPSKEDPPLQSTRAEPEPEESPGGDRAKREAPEPAAAPTPPPPAAATTSTPPPPPKSEHPSHGERDGKKPAEAKTAETQQEKKAQAEESDVKTDEKTVDQVEEGHRERERKEGGEKVSEATKPPETTGKKTDPAGKPSPDSQEKPEIPTQPVVEEIRVKTSHKAGQEAASDKQSTVEAKKEADKPKEKEDKSDNKRAQEPSSQATQKSEEKQTKKSEGTQSENASEKMSEKSAEKDHQPAKPAEKPESKPAEKSEKKSAEKDEKSAQKSADKDEKSAQKSADKDEKPTQKSEKDEKSAQKSAAKPDSKSEGKSDGKPGEKSEQKDKKASEEKPTSGSSSAKPTSQKPSKTAADESAKTQQEDYAKAAITNKGDFKIRHKLDEAENLLQKGKYEDALRNFDNILRKHPKSPRAQLGRADTLDEMASRRRSNEILEQCILGYERLMYHGEDVLPELMKTTGRKLSKKQQFRGWGSRAARTLQFLVERFPEDLTLLRELGVSHLMVGQNKDARRVFQQMLKADPEDGFAQVHLGFIVKTTDNDPQKAVPLLQSGINSEHEGTQDGRFYFHLGDAYQRLGRMDEARKVYQRGADRGLFLSADQRSLYNVDGLKSRPWWTRHQTGYQHSLKLLEDNWETIRDEGLRQLDSESGFFRPEAESLREKGDWKQLTMYQQGRQNKKVCEKVPKTCALVEQIPDAKGCKRGQVKFSVMQPGVHVWPHCGPTNCRIRAHLGLVVPQGPRIRVVNETRTWKEGKFIIFDDSFEHEVWHDGDSVRLVLIVDFWHPDLTEEQKRTLVPI